MDNEYQIAYYPALAKAMPQQLVEGNVESPTAISNTDMIDMGLAYPDPDNEEAWSTCPTLQNLEPCTIQVHKARIPLSRKINL